MTSTTTPPPAPLTPSQLTTPAQATTRAWIDGMIGMLIFSGSLPATRVAVGDFSPTFLTAARAIIAAALGLVLLVAARSPRPQRGDAISLIITSLGVVVGFPLLTALALRHITAAHSIVFIGLLPLSTAMFAVLRGHDRPRPAFWFWSALGAATVVGFALSNGPASPAASVAGQPPLGDPVIGGLLMVGAVLVCGLGYAEGAILTRRLGGWQTISWALLIAAPLMLPVAWITWPPAGTVIHVPAWIGLAYVSIFSMLVGFIFWYRGLAAGGIARVGQLQLFQPFFGLALAGLLLGETVAPSMVIATTIVIACVVRARRS